ncbi:MAG TPA: M12 family metallo-peptidase, partial [Pyrinomonadaceae bacterium]
MSTITAFGQEGLEKDLKKSFRNYDLVKLDNKVVAEKAKTQQAIEVQAYGRYFRFVLTPNDLRAKNYRAVESGDAGERELKQSEVTTYKGKLSGDDESEVRFNISEGNIEGFIYTGSNEKFFVTKAERFSKNASKSDAIVYGENDLIKTVDLSDDTRLLSPDIEEKIDFGYGILESDAFGSFDEPEMKAATAADLKELEVATEADYQWVTQSGGAAAANTEILNILNLVDGIYKRDLNLTVKVTFQHAWSSADPFSTASSIALLDSFLAYWNANYPVSQKPRDTAHLFTGKFTNQGIAYSGVICVSPSYAYGLTGRSGSVNHLITAHEIGHNLNGDHVDNSGACASSIMNPVISFNATTFCEASKSQIGTFTASGGCLSSSSSMPSCTYSISPGSQNFSASGGTGSVTVSTQSGCSWSAAANQNFIGITSGNSGNGSGTVTYSVAANSDVGRTGSITIAGQTFVINQTGAPVNHSISGTITYGIRDANQAVKVVPSVNLSASGTSFLSTTSNSSGNYQLTGIVAGGNYTVTPSKNGDVSAINSLDATRIQQYLVGQISLTPNQLLAADVDGSGTVTSLDAARMQQYLVGISSTNNIGRWRFVPANRQYNSVTGSLTGQNFEAILIGEVSGNWA